MSLFAACAQVDGLSPANPYYSTSITKIYICFKFYNIVVVNNNMRKENVKMFLKLIYVIIEKHDILSDILQPVKRGEIGACRQHHFFWQKTVHNVIKMFIIGLSVPSSRLPGQM